MNTTKRLTIFGCRQSAAGLLEEANEKGLLDKYAVKVIPVPCSGRVTATLLLQALEKNADKVLVLACHDDACQYLDGNKRCSQEIEYTQQKLQEAGLDSTRLVMQRISNVQPSELEKILNKI